MSARLKLACLLVLPAWLAVATVRPAGAQTAAMAAVVNGDVVTQADVENRARFFALATGQRVSPDVLQRLKPQILQQLINERLELQQAERLGVVVTDRSVAASVGEIEKSNNMQPGTLRAKLGQLGISFDTLVNQVRTQLAWTQVLHQTLGDAGRPTEAEVDRRIAIEKSKGAQPQFNVGEIFIPISNHAAQDDAQRFADTVIQQLRAGAPFPIIAAQFSQGETALQGGSLGWVGPDQLDPAVLALVTQMPIGAVSNPVQVAGGLVIVQLRGRQGPGQTDSGPGPAAPGGGLGTGAGVYLSVRQVFLPFTQPLNAAHPTPQQEKTLITLHKIAASVHSCSEMEAANQTYGGTHPVNPGPVNLAQVSPPRFQQLLASLPVGKTSPPLVADDGVSLVMVCGHTAPPSASATAAAAGQSERQVVAQQIFTRRIELSAEQTLDDLRRRGDIQIMH
jgi:peptidyl-prolyl cis-trans isomerase SurA